jgi:hypothetical protein
LFSHNVVSITHCRWIIQNIPCQMAQFKEQADQGFYVAAQQFFSGPSIPPNVNMSLSTFGGLEVACWPLIHKFVGSNPAEAIGFFRAKKSSTRFLSEGK